MTTYFLPLWACFANLATGLPLFPFCFFGFFTKSNQVFFETRNFALARRPRLALLLLLLLLRVFSFCGCPHLRTGVITAISDTDVILRGAAMRVRELPARDNTEGIKEVDASEGKQLG